jgi:hypothetical protein
VLGYVVGGDATLDDNKRSPPGPDGPYTLARVSLAPGTLKAE